MRTFISINIDETTKEGIFKIQRSVKEKVYLGNQSHAAAIKWEGKDKFHLTLFFIGDVSNDQLKEIDNELTGVTEQLNFGGIRFRTTGVSAFPNLRYPRVIILELINEDEKILELSEMINAGMKAIGLKSDKKFHPHITLGRVKRDQKLNLTDLKNIHIPEINFSVKNFFLMESKLNSKGSEYSVMKEYSLIG